ncbi:glucose-6-phosphate dehydrogenase [Streptomyces sp. NPDC085479]|uniref:glucose-6-phosphate dehydrogenase n=1 Tax=Streptomyces sp. NPDC085479 TaxID=3365726 RepID=UPI0037D5C5B7
MRGRGDALVLFGITGDLAKKMLLPALFRIWRRGGLPERVIGVTRGGWTLERLRAHARESVTARESVDDDAFARFAAALRLATVDYDDPASFASIAQQAEGCRILAHYLAIPPVQYARAAELLAGAGLNGEAWLAVEKPFGHDLASARALQGGLTRYFPDGRLLRVDHFLGKEAVENLLTFRFANTLLTGVLQQPLVRSVQITMAEDFGVEDRGGFYDSTGTVRDVVQNHLLQTLAYFVMEAPRTGSASDVLDERLRALRAVRTVLPEDCVFGQYAGYLEVPGVRPGSRTETYAALRTWVDTDRWAGVPFTIRAGKALARTETEIAVELRRPTARYHHTTAAQSDPGVVRLRISPRPGVSFHLFTQHADTPSVVVPVTAAADFTDLDGDDVTAYEHVLADVLAHDTRRFTSMALVKESWRIVGEILDAGEPLPYERGSDGPQDADRLAADRRWLTLDDA